MKKNDDKQRRELEEFEAYGEYTYAYQHSAEEHAKKSRKAHPDDTLPTQEEDQREDEAPRLTPEQALYAAQERARARSRAITGRLLFLFAIAVVGIIILQGTVFRLTTVYVVGNVTKTAQQVAAASGLVKGLNIFAISEEEVRKNLSNDHTLVFLGLRKDYPSTIYLYISERQPVAATQWLGLLYTLDAEGIVMEERNTLDMPANMPQIMGLQVTNIAVGQSLDVRNREQMQAYRDIMAELNLQQYREQVLEVNLSNPNDLYLLTAAGISVRLGNRSAMRAKIGAMRTDMAYLLQLGKSSGTLDVTIPEDAKYRPES